MVMVSVPGGTLDWTLTDLTPPWVSKPEVVLMHHGIGANRHVFDDWLPALIGRCQVLRFDMRGHGGSSPADGSGLAMDRLADDLFAVMDAAGVERAHLIGESIGGTIVLAASLREPGRVRSLTVSNGAHVGASIQSVQNWREIIDTRGMAGWSAYMMAGRFHPGAISDEQWRWFEAQQATACPRTVLALLSALVGADLVDRLTGLAMPVMLLHPDGSPFIPVSVMADFQARVRGARLHVIGNAKHGLPFSHAGVCSRLLAGFLAEVG